MSTTFFVPFASFLAEILILGCFFLFLGTGSGGIVTEATLDGIGVNWHGFRVSMLWI